MAVKARGEITLTSIVDIASTTRYYKLQSSTLAKPAKPTVNPPSGWVTTEPAYTAGATNSLYTCDLTVFSDGTWSYSDVSLSSSYEAAKDAYNKAVAAAKTATDYMDFGADGLIVGDMTDGALSGNVRIASDGIELRDGTSVLARLNTDLLELAANSVNASIDLCNGTGVMETVQESYDIGGGTMETKRFLQFKGDATRLASSYNNALETHSGKIDLDESNYLYNDSYVRSVCGSSQGGAMVNLHAATSPSWGRNESSDLTMLPAYVALESSGSISIKSPSGSVNLVGLPIDSTISGIKINDKNLADFVVEKGQGSNADIWGNPWSWNWRKWSSGCNELWGQGILSPTYDNSYGSLWYRGTEECTYPFRIGNRWYVQATVTGENGLNGVSVHSDTADGVKFYLWDSISGTRTIHLKLYVTGFPN